MDTSETKPEPIQNKPRTFGRKAIIISMIGAGVIIALVINELRSSRLQARFFTRIARDAAFQVKPGASKAIRFPNQGGPYDQRLGYTDLPRYLKRLQERGYIISAQAAQSSGMAKLTDKGVTTPLISLGLFPPYHEKDQAGLTLNDGYGQSIYQSLYPQRVYPNFDALPPLLVAGLLYIENHTLLDEGNPKRNPAIEWSRFGKALTDKAAHLTQLNYHAPGASTLATQIEKFRHSPDGRTGSSTEKLRQMLSASIRSYSGGEDTTATRRQLVVEYLNTVPLAARPGFGEISGIGDGMWAWYGRSFDEVNRILDGKSSIPVEDRAAVFKEAFSLMISQRGPSTYLNGDMKVLEALTDSYLRLMAKDKVITPELRDAALKVSLQQQKEHVSIPTAPPTKRKGANAIRLKLAGLLGVPRMYDLDLLDLSVNSTLDSKLQQEVTNELIKLRDPAHAKSVGLDDKFLLQQGSPEGVTYSFTLIERTPEGNKVRVQADNFDQPFDINEGAKLDLGSTAKFRTLVTYLQVINALHKQYSEISKEELVKIKPSTHESTLRRWAIDYLKQASDHSLSPMLEAALERQYSANPGERFFTGGGMHSFANFDRNENGLNLSVREATRRSVNLVYIRLMRDIAHYYMYPGTGDESQILEDVDNPKRHEYLKRFADREGRTFMASFYHKYNGKKIEDIDALLVEHARKSPKRLAVIFRSIAPTAGIDQFTAFLSKHLNPPQKVDETKLAKLYEELGPDRFNLADRGYLASVHPLELWMVAYMHDHPNASWSDLTLASTAQRQEVYQWLFNSRHKAGQDKRIKEIMEIDAFQEIHKAWKQMGYPFDSLVPSYASALGASADRPASLAELMGILSNDGVRLPMVYIDGLHFAAGTPYDTALTRTPPKGERILPPEIAQSARRVLSEVVDKGTARRVSGVFNLPDGTHILVGGKTGTGDNRFKTFSKGGALASERVVSRSGAFVFYIGNCYFGTSVAYVAGPKAANYKFTSALPVQVLKVLAPLLKQRLELEQHEHQHGLEVASNVNGL